MGLLVELLILGYIAGFIFLIISMLMDEPENCFDYVLVALFWPIASIVKIFKMATRYDI